MPHSLPQELPKEITLAGATWIRISPPGSTFNKNGKGFCDKNDGTWYYYTTALGKEQRIGGHRHFSVHVRKNERSVHISMKSRPGKPDDIKIWYVYDAHRDSEGFYRPVGWGRTQFDVESGERLAKAISVLDEFLTEMSRQAGGGTVGAIRPNLVPAVQPALPQLVLVPDDDDEWTVVKRGR